MTLDDFSDYTRHRVNDYLKQNLSLYTPATHLQDAMMYSLFNGGKRVRPMLTYAAASLFGPACELTDASAAAVESIHAYSLIHDDLPAMDDDDLRRGKPTCHIQFDEATAILAGDALQTFAFELLSDVKHQSTDTQLQLIQELVHASGRHGMVTGQMIDLANVDKDIDVKALEQMHQHKTGALIRASVRMGAISTGAHSERDLAALDAYAAAIGLAFQVQDDIIDITSDTATLGKTQFSDEEANKPTYPKLLGLEGAQALAKHLHKQAITAVSPFGEAAKPLVELANYIIDRNH
ncbi:MAG: (2E,6E)-farnesyl diphosphate synthase [Marinomonas foliarum]|uniref:(2E,6E)-farnesyl diphosphate synthase n=1 Tax=Marinomonas foliarum TaxID=491950 RepID=A0A369AF84_9GAMM|nr:farnesyl diphosphate synthase [Marinomonas foliarum]QRV24929.1 (2E,6E)-farnesyl diphosphate synthase [Marinomonas foliarum]RCX07979.1 farnesyl diphosphate synthase/geranylgeranyl diphosphate synthase type II [Marinomonas foliarum]